MYNQKQPQGSIPLSQGKTNPHIDALLREAKKLHRAAKTGSISQALPVLRRLHATNVCYDQSITSLFKIRHTLQRKHFLRMLAIEAGYPSWEQYKPALLTTPTQDTDLASYTSDDISQLNLWFSTQRQAREYAKENGGKVLAYGQQAVVVR
ncbi:hypothetical protein [Psychrobium sp. 1_MG-2023]|uniref:hypothetical protein n=1 Tax=Psychrobium sp. 1_MG-2023 TaxID=3062624 RepID=UPI00273770D0|nr:hypothetical protein [Psychrobium sp. 1_MG-2023]MDP2560424.1 hypothetical protein [Psychrobium sp. 1_MG-2023]